LVIAAAAWVSISKVTSSIVTASFVLRLFL
jgi:hypothetical protein